MPDSEREVLVWLRSQRAPDFGDAFRAAGKEATELQAKIDKAFSGMGGGHRQGG